MNQTVFITGANRGLGLGFTQKYLKNDYHVIATCRNPDNAISLSKLKKEYHDHLEIYSLDVIDKGQIENLSQSLSNRPIDILINNAGIYGDANQSFEKIDSKQWLEIIQANTMAPTFIYKSLQKNLEQGLQKKAAFITSLMGSINDNNSGGCYLYRSSKAALNAVIKSMSVDFESLGIIHLLIHPGWVRTDMGGPHGLISIEESINGIYQVIQNANSDDNGHFIQYDGKPLTW